MNSKKISKEIKLRYQKELGTIINIYREKRRMTTAVLGEKIGRNQATISRYEKGEIGMSPATLNKMMDVLQIEENKILTLDEFITYQEDVEKRLGTNVDTVQLKYILNDDRTLSNTDITDVTSMSRYWLIEDLDVFMLGVSIETINKIIPIYSIAAISPNSQPEDGDIVFFKYDEKYDLRHIYTTPSTIILESDSYIEEYDPIIITKKEQSNLEVMGVLIGFISNQDRRPK